jgi:hypothetical protein
MLAGIFPIRPDRKGILFYQAFYVWRYFPIMEPQKIMARFVCGRVVYLKVMFPAFAVNDHMSCND